MFSVQFDTFTPQSHVILIFARTANRLNVAYVLTEADVAAIDPDTKIGEINLGEYIFEGICATDAPIDEFNTELTPEELDSIAGRESESDRAFRKLFEQNISGNRFGGIVPNKRGIEYRLDNAGPKSVSALDIAGVGDLHNPSYRDASSKIIKLDWTSPYTTPDGQTRPLPQAGDVIYLSYIAVREHYIRQSVNVRWSLSAISLPPQCFGVPATINAAHYRFYDWDIVNSQSELPLRLSGWRVVESFNAPVNFTAAVLSPEEFAEDSVLGNFLIGGGSGVRTVSYLPASITPEQLDAFINNRATLPTYSVDLRNSLGDASYSINAGPISNVSRFSFFSNYNDAREHIFFNVHTEALKKRDVDKIGIERFVAQQIESDLQAGRLSLFPFMDDPNVVNPFAGSLTTLSRQNMLFQPIEPVSRWTTANGEVECGVGGGVALGDFTGGFGDVLAIFNIVSPITTERFEKDTRVLVEQHATFGEVGTKTIAIEGAAGLIESVSCTRSKSRNDAFALHLSEDNFILVHLFSHGNTFDAMRRLDYRPDQESLLSDSNDPRAAQFPEELGYNCLVGDGQGVSPGTLVSLSNVAVPEAFRFKTNAPDVISRIRDNVTPDKIDIVPIQVDNDKVVVRLSTGYYGVTYLYYTLSGSDSITAMLLFKSGEQLSGTVDAIDFQPSTKERILVVNHKWQHCDSIEIVGVSDVLNINKVTILQLEDQFASDFLDEQSSSTEEDKQSDLAPILYSKNIFFESEVISATTDNTDRLYIFFSDKDGGISCLQTNDRGKTYYYYYGVVEKINEPMRFPFVINAFKDNKCFLFFEFMGKILCKAIDFSMFKFEDSNIIERFATDRLVTDENTGLPMERLGLFGDAGRALRRDVLSYVAGGDMTDSVFLSLLGKNPDTNEFEPFEQRLIEFRDSTTGNINIEERKVRINPLVLGTGSAFLNQDINDLYFSAYRSDKGQMYLFYLGTTLDTAGGGKQLQCNFSTDNGKVWYDLWEYIEYGYRRLRRDPDNHSQFIDRSATREDRAEIIGVDPQQSQQASSFGINVHWSRLRRHKIEGGTDVNAESQVLEIESPYVFYQHNLNQVFLFYIYQGCLLCKVFSESLFDSAFLAKEQQSNIGGMVLVKQVVERDTRSFFIDGNLDDPQIREELHYFINSDTNERMVEGNIVFHHQHAIARFNNKRTISAQRVCAYMLPNCNIRVFYKHDQSNRLRAALWNGTVWIPEDMLRKSNTLPPVTLDPKPPGLRDVTGGFGGTGFDV